MTLFTSAYIARLLFVYKCPFYETLLNYRDKVILYIMMKGRHFYERRVADSFLI